MQKDLRKIFFQLLQQGLWGKMSENNIPTLTPQEWDEIYRISRKQAVQGIIYDGINQLDSDHQPPMALMIKWTVEIDAIERANKKQRETIEQLHSIFTQENNLRLILLKGQANGAHYPAPDHRICGDIDLYFYDKAEQAHSIIEDKGIYIEKETSRKKSNNATYTYNGVPVDHRIRIITLHNPFTRRKLKKLQNRWLAPQQLSTLKVGSTDIATLPPTVSHLMQIAHIQKHLLTEGIGLRQMCDMAMTLHATHHALDTHELAKQLKTLGLYKIALLIYAFIEQYLGYPRTKLPLPTGYNPQPLLQDIWESGNFGQTDKRNQKSSNTLKRKLQTFRKILEKCLLFARYTPGEAFWWPMEEIYSNSKKLLKTLRL